MTLIEIRLHRHGSQGKEESQIIADNLSKTGWSWGCVSAIHSNARTIWIADCISRHHKSWNLSNEMSLWLSNRSLR
jgi:hypothetical protein